MIAITYSTTTALRSAWRVDLKKQILERTRLYGDCVERIRYGWGGRQVDRMPLQDIARLELVVRHKRAHSRVRVRMQDGGRYILRVPQAVTWKQHINTLKAAYTPSPTADG